MRSAENAGRRWVAIGLAFASLVVEYTEDGTLQPAEGIETVSAFDYLP